jgi:hypothetical protein
MQPTLKTLKQWELRRKHESITAELKIWEEQTAAGTKLAKHYRQVRALVAQMTGMINLAQQEVDALAQSPTADAFFSQLDRAGYLILEIHRIWQYFRQKLYVRQGPPLSDVLEALDEFVWDCYNWVVAQSERKEPPLVFFNGDVSPEAMYRRKRLVPEPSKDDRRGRYGDELDGKLLSKIVIPIISLPWHQTNFLPEALLLAHETGHLVEDELQLGPQIDQNLRNAGIDAGRLERDWLPWRAEVFADMYGVLCVGPAFVGILTLLVARDPQSVFAPVNGYPSHHLRILLAICALEDLGFASDAKSLKAAWVDTYTEPAGFVQHAHIDDLQKVVKAILGQPLAGLTKPGKKPLSLKQLGSVRWTMQHQIYARDVADRLLRANEGLRLGSTNPRILLAAGLLAFQQQPELLDANKISSYKLQSMLIDQILAERSGGIRDASREQEQQAGLKQVLDTAHIKGQALATQLLEAFDQDSL